MKNRWLRIFVMMCGFSLASIQSCTDDEPKMVDEPVKAPSEPGVGAETTPIVTPSVEPTPSPSGKKKSSPKKGSKKKPAAKDHHP